MEEQAPYNNEASGGVAEKASEAIRDLINVHWARIISLWGDEPKMQVGFRVTLKEGVDTIKVDTSIKFGQSVTDDREDYVDKPDSDQHRIQFEG